MQFKRKAILLTLIISLFVQTFAANVISWVPSYFIDKCLSSSGNGTLTMDMGGVTMGDGLTHLALQFWAPNPNDGSIYYIANGGVTATDSDVQRFVTWGDNNNVKTLLCVYNNDGTWNWDLVKPILDNSTKRANFASSLVTTMEELNLDGIELDLEGAGTEANADKTNFFLFLNDLIAQVQAKGKEVTVASYHYIYNQPSQLWWDDMVNSGVTGITSMGYTDIGMSAAGWQSYASQKAALTEHDKLMLGMPTYAGGSWQGNTVLEQVTWAVNNGVGVGIWDASLGDGNGSANSSWRTASVWNKLAEIKAVSSSNPTVNLTTKPASTTTETQPTFSWSGSDADGTIAHYLIGMDNSTPSTQTTATTYTPSSPLSTGSHIFYIQAVDNEGNRSSVVSHSFYVSDGSSMPNLLEDGDFAQSNAKWSFYAHNYSPHFAQGTGSIDNEQFVMKMSAIASSPANWHGQLTYTSFSLESGKKYELSFDAKSTSNRTISWTVQENGGSWAEYNTGSFSISNSMQNYSTTFTATTTDPAALFNIGIGASTAEVTIDNIVLREYVEGSTITIAASAGTGGTISPNGVTSITSGGSQSYSITANAGYTILDVKVNGSSVGIKSAHTFSNVTSNQTIEATFVSTGSQTVNYPFPQNLDYGLEPAKTDAQLAQAITDRYDWYKTNYLKQENGKYYIESRSTDGSSWTKTVSEAHGYGMMLTAIMAGYDSNAKTYFDGMVEYYKQYKRSNSLMNWKVWSDGSNENGSATDGDMDIAYALILAYKQWGDESYKTLATAIINSIWDNEFYNVSGFVPTPGDLWTSNGSYTSTSYTRPSDWMTGHLRAFDEYSTKNWSSAISGIYNFYNTYSHSTTGLVPDFYKGYAVAPANGIEGPYDGEYYYNACRVPLRFAMDYATSASSESNAALTKIGNWLNGKTGGSAANIKVGYYLDGDAINTGYQGVEFLATFGAGLIATSHQALLNDIWNSIQNDWFYESNGTAYDNSYGASLSLLSMIVMSGNWWDPTNSDPVLAEIVSQNTHRTNLNTVEHRTDSVVNFDKDTVLTYTNYQRFVDSTFSVTDSLRDGVSFWKDSTLVSAVIDSSSLSTRTVTREYQATLSERQYDTTHMTDLGTVEHRTDSIVDVEKDTVLTYMNYQRFVDSTFSVTDFLSDGVSFRKDSTFVSAVVDSTVLTTRTVTRSYQPTLSASVYDTIHRTDLGTVEHRTDSVVNVDKDTVLTYSTYNKTVDSTFRVTDSLSDNVSFKKDSVFISAVYDSSFVSSRTVTRDYQPTITSTTRDTVHRVDLDLVEHLTDSVVSKKNKDTTLTYTTYQRYEDSTYRVTDSLSDGVSFWTDSVLISVVVDSSVVSTRTVVRSNQGMVTTTSRDTVHRAVLGTVEHRTDSIVDSNKDTVLTFTTFEKYEDSTYTVTDSLRDGISYWKDSVLLSVIIDSAEVSSRTETVTYQPTLSASVYDTIHRTDLGTAEYLTDSIVNPSKDTVLTYTTYNQFVDSTFRITDSLSDGVSFRKDSLFVTAVVDSSVLSTRTENRQYQGTITSTTRDTIHRTELGTVEHLTDSVVDPNKDTVLTYTTFERFVDSTFTVTDSLEDGVSYWIDSVVVAVVEDSSELSTRSETRSYSPIYSEQIETQIYKEVLDTVEYRVDTLTGINGGDSVVLIDIYERFNVDTVQKTDSLLDGEIFKTEFQTVASVFDSTLVETREDTLYAAVSVVDSKQYKRAAVQLSANPVRPEESEVIFTIPENSTDYSIAVLDAVGNTVFTEQGGSTVIRWDLRNYSGVRVAGGGYKVVIRLTNENGENALWDTVLGIQQ